MSIDVEALDGLEQDLASADHDCIEDGPAFARGGRWVIEKLRARLVPAEDERPAKEYPPDDVSAYVKEALTIPSKRVPAEDEVAVRRDTGGVFADGTTNHPPIDFDASNEPVPAEDEGWTEHALGCPLRDHPNDETAPACTCRPAEDEGRLREAVPIYCTAGCDACRDYARELGVPLIVLPPALAAHPEPRPGADWTDPKG